MPRAYLTAYRGAILRRGTIADHARELGVTPAFLNRVLRGEVEMSGKLWRKSVLAFGPKAERAFWKCLVEFWRDVMPAAAICVVVAV